MSYFDSMRQNRVNNGEDMAIVFATILHYVTFYLVFLLLWVVFGPSRFKKRRELIMYQMCIRQHLSHDEWIIFFGQIT